MEVEDIEDLIDKLEQGYTCIVESLTNQKITRPYKNSLFLKKGAEGKVIKAEILDEALLDIPGYVCSTYRIIVKWKEGWEIPYEDCPDHSPFEDSPYNINSINAKRYLSPINFNQLEFSLET